MVRAPIALFAYRRPQHLRAVLHALAACPEARETKLYVFSDGPKDRASARDVEEVRSLLARIDGFMSVDIVLRDDNYGLAKNITQGVSAVLEQHSSVIVVEDDILVSPFFLGFMNQALDRYQDEARVGSISGYCYPVSCDWSETYFIRGSDCWGWATWRNRWRNFDPDGRELLRRLRDRNLTTAFDFDSAMGFTQMLEDQVAGRNDSWAVRWHASCFLRDLLILYPARALAQNIGHDGSGTHSVTESEFFDVSLSATPVVVEAIPIEESILGRQAIREFFMKGRTSAPPRRSVKQHVFTALAKLKSRLTR